MRESSGITWRLFTYSDDVGWRKKATQSNSKAAILLFILFEFILFYFAMTIKKSTGIYERRAKKKAQWSPETVYIGILFA
jgi:hypothetical protein